MEKKTKIKKPPVWKRKYLVQRNYQLSYSFLIAIIGAIALLTAYYSIKYLESTGVVLGLMAPNINILNVTTFMFVSWFLLGIIYTHTTAGPVTQLINQINTVGNNDLDKASVTFRRGDDLQDLPEYFNNMVKVLQFRKNEEYVLLKELESHLAQAVKSESKGEAKRDEIAGALKYCIQRTQNLVSKKERYLRPRDVPTANQKQTGEGAKEV